ncbi:hypothetical protein SMD11_1416 [Streptomyces albireticuli]|uniref:Uncharacterized protein n=1 Tax=Streptomyces albireticuli TaxID=1940 RepID=A0A1Z2KYD6_9ACTN|nr:hypothetical protein SMD11_1416 [Streptomyces albireticuli]
MFQVAPVQPANSLSRESHCCWVPDRTRPSISESARKPPLDQPPSSRSRSPRMCTRRSGAACETAQRFAPESGRTERFSAERQKFWVALPWNQSASARTAPRTVTSSGDRPSPATWVAKPVLTSTS